MRRLSPAIVVLTAVLALAAGCGGDGAAADGPVEGRVPVVATTTQLADFARVVGGNHVDVHGILKANVDAHDFEPSPADIARLAGAKVIVKNGVGLEDWFEATIRSADPKGTIVDASTGVTLRRAAAHEDEQDEGDHPPDGAHTGDADPHIWLDPRNAKLMVRTIAAALVAVDPAHQAEYEANEAAYAAELDRLDGEIAAQIGGLANKKLVSNHDALGYYVDRYGLEYVGSIIPSFDSSAELSAADVSAVVRRIKAAGVNAVFSEASIPRKTADAIGRDAGVTVVAGDDALYVDSLGPAGSPGATYLEMLRHNTRVIVDHLR